MFSRKTLNWAYVRNRRHHTKFKVTSCNNQQQNHCKCIKVFQATSCKSILNFLSSRLLRIIYIHRKKNLFTSSSFLRAKTNENASTYNISIRQFLKTLFFKIIKAMVGTTIGFITQVLLLICHNYLVDSGIKYKNTFGAQTIRVKVCNITVIENPKATKQAFLYLQYRIRYQF